jgi:hypothetical protein
MAITAATMLVTPVAPFRGIDGGHGIMKLSTRLFVSSAASASSAAGMASCPSVTTANRSTAIVPATNAAHCETLARAANPFLVDLI